MKETACSPTSGHVHEAGHAAPEGYACYDIPRCTIAKAWVEGEEYDIYASARALTSEAAAKNGYEPDTKDFFQCEVYTDERFGVPKNNGERILTLDYCMPCVKS